MTRTLLLSLMVLLVILGSGYAIYRHGYKLGYEDVQSEWRQREAKLVARVAELEAVHARAQEEVAREAQSLREAHLADVAAQRAVYEQRLSQSARRAEVYRSQAEAGTVAARDLAAHAARLDSTLEEGRGLVRELRTTLGLREDQLRLLGKQIMSDRQTASENMQ
jgi:hypothetical protein